MTVKATEQNRANLPMERLMLHELLERLNNNPEMLRSAQNFTPYIGRILISVFQTAYLKECKLDLPEGQPPFTPDNSGEGLSPANPLRVIATGIFDTLRSKTIKPMIKERTYIRLLEGIHPKDAKIFCAIKDQTLDKEYPNLTHHYLHTCGILPKPTLTVTESEEMFRKQAEEAVVAQEQSVSVTEPEPKPEAPKPKAKKRTTTRSRVKKTANATQEVKAE